MEKMIILHIIFLVNIIPIIYIIAEWLKGDR